MMNLQLAPNWPVRCQFKFIDDPWLISPPPIIATYVCMVFALVVLLLVVVLVVVVMVAVAVHNFK